MADTKITGLQTPQVTTNPATDVLPIVNIADNSMAASGSTRKITVNQLLGAGGTATLASATISGDLTVDTSTLKVDSANDRVGIGLAAGINAKLHVSSTGSVHINQRTGGNGCFTQYVDPVSSNYVGTDSGNFRVANNSAQDLLNIQQLGVFTFGDGAGGTRMTLNSTGLGVGGGPTSKLHVSNTGAATRITITDDTTNGRSGYIESNFSDALVIGTTSGVRAIRFSPDNKPYYQIATDGVQTWLDGIGGTRMTLNATGLGVGVTATLEKLQVNGGIVLSPPSTPTTLTTNGQLTVNATSNTNLRFSYRGSDGVTRVANITLA